MKFGIATLAAIGFTDGGWGTAPGGAWGVSAHQHEHNIKVAAVDTIYKKYYGESVINTCPVAPERYGDGEFIRILMKEAHKSSIIATYEDVNEENYPVSEDCFGDWMKSAWSPIHKIHKKAHDDFWSVSYGEWQTYQTAWLDIMFKNKEACQIEKIGDDMISHCLADEDACWNKMGQWKNYFYNIVPISTEIVETIQEFKDQPLCVGDGEIIDGIAHRYANWIDIIKMVHGLHINWERSEEVEHVSIKEYKNEKKAWKSVNHPFLEKIAPWVIDKVQAFFQ